MDPNSQKIVADLARSLGLSENCCGKTKLKKAKTPIDKVEEYIASRVGDSEIVMAEDSSTHANVDSSEVKPSDR